MKRSKFNTKAYGPTKPTICKKGILPEGLLPPGPGARNIVHALLRLEATGTLAPLMYGVGSCDRTTDPNVYEARLHLYSYAVKIIITIISHDFATVATWEIRLDGKFVTGGYTGPHNPKTIDPFDTGPMTWEPPTADGQAMIRMLARY